MKELISAAIILAQAAPAESGYCRTRLQVLEPIFKNVQLCAARYAGQDWETGERNRAEIKNNVLEHCGGSIGYLLGYAGGCVEENSLSFITDRAIETGIDYGIAQTKEASRN